MSLLDLLFQIIHRSHFLRELNGFQKYILALLLKRYLIALVYFQALALQFFLNCFEPSSIYISSVKI
jgi:hypothetical protein